MKLTPLDIQQQQFASVLLGGFNKDEVNRFLDILKEDVEDLIRDNNSQRSELQRKEAELQEFRERERTLKETMLTATRITEDIKQNARKEAEIVIAQAEAQAEQIVQNAHTRLVRIMEDLDELRRQKAQFEASLRSIISTHFKLLDATMAGDKESEAGLVSLLNRRRPAAAAEGAEGGRSASDGALLKPRGGDR